MESSKKLYVRIYTGSVSLKRSRWLDEFIIIVKLAKLLRYLAKMEEGRYF